MKTKNESLALRPLNQPGTDSLGLTLLKPLTKSKSTLELDRSSTKLSKALTRIEAKAVRKLTAKWITEDCIARSLPYIRLQEGGSRFINQFGLVAATYSSKDSLCVEPDEPWVPCFQQSTEGGDFYIARVDVSFPPPGVQVDLFESALRSVDQFTDNYHDANATESPNYIAIGADVLAIQIAKLWKINGYQFAEGVSAGALILATNGVQGVYVSPFHNDKLLDCDQVSRSPFVFVHRDWWARPEDWAIVDETEWEDPAEFGIVYSTECRPTVKQVEKICVQKFFVPTGENSESIANPPQVALAVTSLPTSATEKINENEIKNSDDDSDKYFEVETTVIEQTKAIKKITWQELEKFTATPSPARKSRIAKANPRIAAFIVATLKRTPCANQFKTMGLREWALVLMATLQLPISTNEVESAAESLGLIDGVRLKVPKGWANANALESSAAKLRRELASK